MEHTLKFNIRAGRRMPSGGAPSLAPLAAALVMAAAPVAAKPGDELTPYAFTSYTYEDNLLRLPDGVSAPAEDGTVRRGDQIWRYGAGIVIDKPISRQRIYANLAYYRNDYNHFNQLDFSGPAIDTYWAWQVGNLWSGRLGYERDRSLSSFSDQVRPQKNIRTQERYYFRPRYELAASLRLRGALEFYRLDNSDFTNSNREDTIYELGIDRVSPQLNSMGVFVRYTDGEYPDRVPIPGVRETTYEQTDVGLAVDWKVTGASRLAGRVGYTDRQFPSESFNGVTGRMVWDWVPTGKTSISFVARRQFEFPEDVLGNAALVQAVSVEPRWNVTPKIALGAFAEYRERDRDLSPIDERYRVLGVTATYAPLDNLQLSVSVRRDQRRTDFPTFDYDANVYSGSAQISF
jgi:exopolysaccharide biosynthesis operon protein EpsL